MTLQANQIYVYCEHPSKRFAFAAKDDLQVTIEDHHMTQYAVDESSIPNNPNEKTFDGATWTQIPNVQADRDMSSLRKQRNKLLAETDWWAMSDVTMTQAQRDYRQALRDITGTYTSLDDVVWPAKP